MKLLVAFALVVALAAAVGSGRGASAPVSATAIAGGLGFSCALTSTGGVKCWGTNGHDELGNGQDSDSRSPVDVAGLSRGVTAIASGLRHSCAITTAGSAKCWGANISGALGDGTTTRRPRRVVDVFGLTDGVTRIATGSDHSCALMSTGGVKCWGSNRFGELGDGTTSDRLTPVDVLGLSRGVTAIAAGGFHSCALVSAGGVKCWGGKDLTPVDVFGLSGVTAITVGSTHNCALTSSRGVKCWGQNDNGQLGDGTTGNRLTPVDVLSVSGGVLSVSGGVTAIAAGAFHSCALTSTGGVKCWGVNSSGELGDGTTTNRTRPVSVIGFGAAKATLAIVSGSVKVTAARVAGIKLRCGARASCQGTLSVTAAMKLGSRTFAIAPGRTQTVKVKLTARGFKLLVRVKRLSARVRISYKQPAGGTATATRTITLVAPRS